MKKTLTRSPAGQSNPSAPVTMKNVAAIAGVSVQTVSFVINNNGSVSEAVRQRVREVADSVGYRPNKSAKAMRTGRSQTLGLIIDDLGHPYWAEYAQAAERAAAAVGYAVLLVDAYGPTVESRIDALRAHPVDGIITTIWTPAVARLELPMVVISGAMRGRDSVISDDVQGGTLVADHLLKLGHRKFGLVTSPKTVGVPVRRQAFLDRLPKGASVRWEWHAPEGEKISSDIHEVLARREATAIVCSNDTIGVRVLQALQQLKIAVPEEVSVIGYDDISWADIVTPALSTVRQPFTEAATRAMDLLIARINQPGRRAHHLKLGVSLVERASTARPVRAKS